MFWKKERTNEEIILYFIHTHCNFDITSLLTSLWSGCPLTDPITFTLTNPITFTFTNALTSTKTINTHGAYSSTYPSAWRTSKNRRHTADVGSMVTTGI
ncbi:hypothetical protein ACFLXH_00425 [Chloroflexota bacterium]